ncbi:sin3A-associated protein 130 isoform X2 [Musca autumnalis]|uniref:sin3A-associated protein 130 isoform X2 n=2 Tax=Musca autumnalis TaxID=221902 RepID=UPI003CE8DE13
MNSSDGGGSGAGPGGGGGGGEPLKIIKTQLIPHPHPVSLQQSQHHSPLPSPTTSTPTPLQLQSSTSITTPNTNTISSNNNSNSQSAQQQQQPIVHHPPSIQLKNPTNVTNLFSLNPVAAKITHVKTTTIDAVSGGAGGSGGISLSGLTPTAIGSGGGTTAGTIVTSGGLSSIGAIKVGNSGAIATSLSGTPIALNSSQASGASGATSIRAIGAGGQSTQVRVVMSNIMSPSMIKQLENAGGPGRTQITTFPTAPARSVSNTSITVTRSATQATYLPRPNATGTQMTGVGMSVPSGQRLVTPIRTTPASVQGGTSGGATVTGITATGNFVRGTAVSRNTSSPATTVISPASSTTWMAANQAGHQVQLIRAIPHQTTRQRIITTQGISGVPVSATGSVASVSGTVVTTTASALQSSGAMVSGQHHTPTSQQQSTIQTVSSASSQQQGAQQQQQTYVATVLPPRQHQATLVYSSNVSGSQQLTTGQQQQFNPTSVAGGGPRFAVATPLTPGSGTTGATRQIRPIPFAKSFSATKLNTTSISIRAPNLPQLAPSMASSGVSNVSSASVAAANSPRSTTVTGVTASSANVIPSTTTRIIQLQQQPGGTTQQIIGSTGRLAANVMLQPIIVNAAGAGKIGIRPPVTMAAKVQPPLTITQLGIGKLPSSSTSTSSVSGGGQQNINTSSGNASPSISSASITVTNLSTNATTQLVNVSQGSGGASGGQLLTTQNLVTSSAAGSTAGGATVVPLTLNARGASGGNILTGTMTPIKNASAITVGKVMTQAQLASPLDNSANSSSNNSNVPASSANVFIHAPTPQRPHSNSSTSSNSGVGGGGVVVNTSLSSGGGVNVSNTSQAPTSVLTSTGSVVAGTFLQPGSTIYYESVPASSVQVSTGVLSLTTTTVTSSTMSQNQIASSAANLSISSLPFVTHAGSGGSTTATFTVVPSTGGRTIGQLQIPVSNAGTQIQTVPVRFSQLTSTGQMANSADAITVSQATASQILQQTGASGGGMETSQIIIPASQCLANVSSTASGGNSSQQQQQTQQMVLPLQTSIKVTSGAGSTGTAVVSNFLRKRDVDGSPIRAAKNLQPTLLSMGNNSSSNNMINNSSSPASSSIGGCSSYSLTSVTSTGSSGGTTVLTAEALAKKDRSSNSLSTPINSSLPSARSSRADSPASSDGSTTVSANSSPGVDQQIQDNNMIINRMTGTSNHSIESHFNPINEQHIIPGTPVTSRNLAAMDHHHGGGGGVANLHGPSAQSVASSSSTLTIQQRLNGAGGGGGPMDCPPRKKSRRSTNDSQLSTHSQASLSLPPPQANNNPPTSLSQAPASMAPETTITNVISNGTTIQNAAAGGAPPPSTPSGNEVVNGKENTKPVEFILKRPKNCTLMSTYKQSWKSAYNHFQRYSDVKPREERRPTIMDLANQNNVLGKINGWKIHYLKSQMEDLCENESLGYEKLSSMLKQMESNGITNEIERISDLLKGNMQRSKIIVDGVSEAQNQIMKIFEHKSHVSDIITRCASKRNYKKREKV